MRKCCYCNKILNGGSKHIFICGHKIDTSKSTSLIKYEFLKYNFPYISECDNLTLQYQTNLRSLPDLKNEYKIDFKSILFLLDYHNIKRRSISESSHKIGKEKYKKTCLDKYGVDNVSKVQFVKDKKSSTFLYRYGVDNIRKSDPFIQWLKVYMLDTYGVGSLPNKNGKANSWGWKNLSEESKNTRINILHTKGESLLEKKIQSILDELNISYSTQYFVNNRSYDIKILNTNKIIEINGDYWHANPNIYNEFDILHNELTAKMIWEKDKIKKENLDSFGYKILYLWESEIKKETKEYIINKLNNFLLSE